MTYVINYAAKGILILILFFLIHAFKFFRMYLVLLEKRINFSRFIFSYCHTTLVNLLIPFKLGELYRVFVYSRLAGSFEAGLLSVIADRFFDTLALVLIMLPLIWLYPEGLTSVAVFLMVFLFAVVFIYAVFPPTYRYLNRYIIINRTSKRSMAVLRALKITRQWYDYVKRLISGRYALLLILSFGAWVFEGGLLFVLSQSLGIEFSAGAFLEYIASILDSTHIPAIQKPYGIMCIILMGVFTVASGCFYIIKLKKKDR